MTILETTPNLAGLLPEDYGPLVIQPFRTAALCTDPAVSTVIVTDRAQFNIPVVKSDGAGVDWIREGDEYPINEGAFDNLPVTPTKVGGVTVISVELANDSSPEAQQQVSDMLASSLATRVDTAYFGNVAASPTKPAQQGLGTLTDASITRVAAGTTPTSVDAFTDAQGGVESAGGRITAWVANPTDATMLAKLKTQTGSNLPLLGTDPTNPTRRQINGVPLIPNPRQAAGVVWGVSAARAFVVIRNNAEVTADRSVFFTSDRVAVKVSMRVGFGFPAPKTVAKVALAAS